MLTHVLLCSGSSEPEVPSAWENCWEQRSGDVCCVCSTEEGSETNQGAEQREAASGQTFG